MKSLAALAVVVCVSSRTSANPRALPFTYTSDTLVEGQTELDEVADMVAQKMTPTRWSAPSAFQLEVQIGVIERLELAIATTFVPGADVTVPGIATGMRQRVRYQLADRGEWPVDVGLYGAVTETEQAAAFEARVIVQRRFGDLRLAANAASVVQLDYAHHREVVLDPSLGATYELTAKLQLGIDSWLRTEFPMHPSPPARTFSLGPAAYVGPAIQYSFGKLWWSLGAYVRVTDLHHTLEPGEPYGPIYVRSMLGYDL